MGFGRQVYSQMLEQIEEVVVHNIVLAKAVFLLASKAVWLGEGTKWKIPTASSTFRDLRVNIPWLPGITKGEQEEGNGK